MGWLWLALAGLPTASADAPEHWVRLYDALLLASVDGDLERAVSDLKLLLRTELEVTDPARAEAVQWLGHTLHELGRTDEARETLLDGLRSGSCSPGCRDLLETLEIDATSVATLPTRWTFDSPEHGFFHQWAFQERGGIRLDDAGTGNVALVWETRAQRSNANRAPDRLVVGFAEMATPAQSISFTATSLLLEGILQIVVEDIDARQYGTSAIELPEGTAVRVAIDLADLVAVDGQSGTLDPARIARLYLVDRTGRARTGIHEIWLDDFTVR